MSFVKNITIRIPEDQKAPFKVSVILENNKEPVMSFQNAGEYSIYSNENISDLTETHKQSVRFDVKTNTIKVNLLLTSSN
jgi:hypothetical protein